MALNTISKEGLQGKGAEFESYAENLNNLLKSMDEKVGIITEEGVFGKASEELVGSYEEISSVVRVYARKISDLGGVIKASAVAKGNIDVAAAKAAGGNI